MIDVRRSRPLSYDETEVAFEMANIPFGRLYGVGKDDTSPQGLVVSSEYTIQVIRALGFPHTRTEDTTGNLYTYLAEIKLNEVEDVDAAKRFCGEAIATADGRLILERIILLTNPRKIREEYDFWD